MMTSLKGQFLIAMPGMMDARFHDAVVYMVAHGEEGAMGIVINQSLPDMHFTDILEEMDLGRPEDLIQLPSSVQERAVLSGGPVERGRGFVLHSADYHGEENTVTVTDDVCLSASIDVLKAISFGPGPENALFALGYCGWSPGQLEGELRANGWLTAPQSIPLLFEEPIDSRYDAALSTLGRTSGSVNRASLSSTSGNA